MVDRLPDRPSLLRGTSPAGSGCFRLDPLAPLAEAAGLQACEDWFERANFALMAATREACATGTAIAPQLSAVMQGLTDGLSALPVTAARDFLGAKSLFVLLASSDLTGTPLPEPGLDELLARFCVTGDDAGDPLRLSQRNNHVLMKALALGLHAARRGDGIGWAHARRLYERYLSSLSPEGIPEQEAVRGASAAWYCNLAVMLLVRFQTLATRHEGPLPADERDRLLRAVAALGRVAEEPSILHPWARRNMYPHPGHGTNPFRTDMGFLSGYHRSRHYLSWVPLFLGLFPSDALPDSLARHVTESSDYFPLCNEFIGGFAELMV